MTDLSSQTHEALRRRAAQNGRSIEAEIKQILDDAVEPAAATVGLGTRLTAIGREFGGVELDISRDRTPAEDSLDLGSDTNPHEG